MECNGGRSHLKVLRLDSFHASTYSRSLKNLGISWNFKRNKKQETKKKYGMTVSWQTFLTSFCLAAKKNMAPRIVAGFLFDSCYWSPVHGFKMFVVARQKCQQWLNALGDMMNS